MFSRKLRDEYDKLEGALRKLGVDPEAVVSGTGSIGLRDPIIRWKSNLLYVTLARISILNM